MGLRGRLYRSIWPPALEGVSGVRQASGERARHAITIIISPSLQLTTCKLIKERDGGGEILWSSRFLWGFFPLTEASRDESAALH